MHVLIGICRRWRPRVIFASLLFIVLVLYVALTAIPAIDGSVQENLRQSQVPHVLLQLDSRLGSEAPGNVLWVPVVSRWVDQYDPLHPSVSVLQLENDYHDVTGESFVAGSAGLPWIDTPEIASSIFDQFDICYIVLDGQSPNFGPDSLSYSLIVRQLRLGLNSRDATQFGLGVTLYRLPCAHRHLVSVLRASSPGSESGVEVKATPGRASGRDVVSVGVPFEGVPGEALTSYWVLPSEYGRGTVPVHPHPDGSISFGQSSRGAITVTHFLSGVPAVLSGYLRVSSSGPISILVRVFSENDLAPLAQEVLRVDGHGVGVFTISPRLLLPCANVATSRVYQHPFVELSISSLGAPVTRISLSPLMMASGSMLSSPICGKVSVASQSPLGGAMSSGCRASMVRPVGSPSNLTLRVYSISGGGCSIGDRVVVFESFSKMLVAIEGGVAMPHSVGLGWANAFTVIVPGESRLVRLSFRSQGALNFGLLVSDIAAALLVVCCVIWAVNRGRLYIKRHSAAA